MIAEQDATLTDTDSVALTFLNDAEARTVEAIAERVIPGDEQNPGATTAGVVYYIDRSLAGVSSDLQPVYRRGLRILTQWCRSRYGRVFTELEADDQDFVVRTFLGPEVGGGTSGLQFSPADEEPRGDEPLLGRLFTIIREHTVEGFFCDPVYGGNRAAVGWKLVGFPGAYWGYTAQQMAPGFDGRSIPIKTLSDLRRELNHLPPNEVFYTEGKR